MSRGPGVWQRAILERLESAPSAAVADLLPAQFTRAQYSALLRAVRTLESAQEILADHRRGLVFRRGYRPDNT